MERPDKGEWQATSPRPLGAPAARRHLFLPVFTCLVLTSCFEIPPELPDDGASPSAHPPRAVYDTDPFDAKNRWFGRAFRLVDAGSSGPG